MISDVNLCYSEFARKYLADTGLPKERTYMTGSPMAEVLRMNLEKIQKSDVLERLGLEPNKYILLAHTEKRTSIQKRTSFLFSLQSMLWQRSMICQFCTLVIHELKTDWRRGIQAGSEGKGK